MLLVLATIVVLLVTTASASANTVLGTTGCSSSAARTIAAPAGGGASLSAEDCTIAFGSSDGTAMLHAYQTDMGGTTLRRGSTGTLDDTFSGDGRLEDDNSAGNDQYRGVAVQPDGKVVVAGVRGTGLDTYVRRYLSNGSMDPTFGIGGERLFGGTWEARDLVLAPDGSIFVLGYGGNSVTVFKLTTSGSLDPTWNNGTWTSHVFVAAGGSGIAAESLAVGRGGEVYVAGYTDMRGEIDMAVLNYTADGRLDSTFDGDGLQVVDIGATDEARGIIEQTDGRVVVAGLASMANHDAAVLRLLPNGQLDGSFDGDGIRTYPIGSSTDYTRAVMQRPTGELLVAGYRRGATDHDPFVLQLLPDGTPDTSFAPGGIAIVPIATTDDLIYDAVLQSDGAVVLAGVHDQADDDLLLARITAAGIPDPTFGSGSGYRFHSGGNVTEELRAVTVGTDGRIAAGGYSGDAGQEHADLLVLDIEEVADYATGTNDFGAGGNAFGACLRSTGGGALTTASTWTVNSSCPLSTGAWWRGLPTGMGTASKVATTTGSGVVDATASLRFGIELSGAEPAGAYQAPITIDVVAPNLDPPENTAVPTISGTARAKLKLTATTGTWSGSATIAHAWQWQRCTPGCADIAGATNSTYYPVTADVGATLRVVVTATNSLGSASATSLPTLSVAAPTTLNAFYVTGFEHRTTSVSGGGVLTSYTGAGSNSIVTSGQRSGAAAMRFQSAGNARQWDVDLPALATHRDAAARLYFRVPSLPNVTQTIAEFESTSSDYCEVQLTNTGMLRAALSGAAADNGPTIETGRWYRIDFDCNMTAANWTHRWAVDGVDQGQLTSSPMGPEFINNFQIGIDTNSTMDITFDDVIATTSASDYPIGPGRAVAITPSRTGTHTSHANFDWSTNNGTGWTPFTPADDAQTPGTAQHIDEWPVAIGGAADVVRSTATSGYLEYEFSDPAITSPINAVGLLVAERSGAGAGRVDIAVDAGAGFQAVQSISPNAAVEYRRSTLTTIPTSGSAWNGTAVDALRFRFSSSVMADVPRVDSVIAEVDVAAGDPPLNFAPPTVSGTPRVGKVLTSTTGGWTPIGGLAFTYQWQNCSPTCSNIAGATSSTYTLAAGDLGDTIRVRVFATNDGGTQAATSLETLAIGSSAPTLTAFDGFEVGAISANGNMYDSTAAAGGTVAADATWARTGARSARIVNTGGAGDTMVAYPMGGTIGVARVSLRLENLITSGSQRELIEFRIVDAASCEIGFDATTNRLYAGISGTKQAGPPVEAGRWYDIDARCNVGGGTRMLDWNVDGVAMTQVTRPEPASTISRFSIGNTGGGTAAYTANYDDVATSQSTADYPLGPIAIDPHAPNQAGTHANPASFGYSTTGGSAFTVFAAENDELPGASQYLDDYPAEHVPGVSGDIIRQAAITDHLEFQLPDSDRLDAPLSVRGLGTHSAATPATVQNARLIAQLGASSTTLYTQDPGDPSNSHWTSHGVMNTRPGGGAWTTADIDTLRLRLTSTDVGTVTGERPWTHNLLVEAAYPGSKAPDAVSSPQVQRPWQSIKVGDLLEVDDATWSDPVTSRSWQWLRCATASTCVPITGATSRSYTVAGADAGSTLRVAESASNVGGRQTVRSTATALVATQPTILMATGFEGGTSATSTDGQTTYGAPTFGSGTVRTGTRALSTTDLAAADGVRYVLPATQQVAVTRAYVRLPDATPDTTTSLMEIAASAPVRSCNLDVQTSGATTGVLFDGTDRDPQAGPTLQANRWYLIEMRVDSSATTWRCDWSIDGEQYVPSVWNFGATDTLEWASVGQLGDDDHVIHYDDWMVSTTGSDYPLGPGRTVALTPDGEGTHANTASFASNSGALGAAPHLRLDELPAWSISDWVSQTVTGAGSYLEWTMSNPSERSSSARAVRSLVGFHSSSALGNDGKTKVVRPGDTDAAAPVVQAGNMSSTTIQWTGAMVPAPTGGWTPNALDQLRMRNGYAVDVSPAPRWEADLLELEYRE